MLLNPKKNLLKICRKMDGPRIYNIKQGYTLSEKTNVFSYAEFFTCVYIYKQITCGYSIA